MSSTATVTAPRILVSRAPQCSTTSCQRLVYEDLNSAGGTGTLVFQTDINHPKLFPVVTGHVVNNVALLPSALYADMAMTAADYFWRTLQPSGAADIGLNVCAMEVHKPVIAEIPPPKDGQHIQMEASADLTQGTVKVNFRTVTWDGKLLQNHGHGLVRYEESSAWLSEWQRTQYLVETQISLLESRLETGYAHKFLRGLAYKLFSSFVQYAPKYQGMEEVIMDSESTAATALIRFQVTDADSDFFCSPYFIDNLCHLSGFIANASELQNPDMTYISHGWKSFKIPDLKSLSANKAYRVYVRMLPELNNVTSGDVYVFDEEMKQVVGVCEGCKFQGIPRRAMSALLSAGASKKR